MKVLFIGPYDSFKSVDAGYGNAAAGIIDVLGRMKEDKDTISTVDLVNTLRPHDAKLTCTSYDVAILVANPNSILKFTTEHPIVQLMSRATRKYLSVVWETDPLPSLWKALWSHDFFTGFLTPSRWVGEMVQRETDKPVYYYPHFIDTERYPAVDLEKKISKSTFNVLFVGQHTKRKGLEDAVISFSRALGNQSDASFRAKAHAMSQREVDVQKTIEAAVITNCGNPNAKIYQSLKNVSSDEMVQLYHDTSLLLFPSRGEGFGLPPCEAMSTGIRVVYTNWSATAEVAASPHNYPADYMLDEAYGMTHHGYEYGSRYAVPRISALITGLKEYYSLWKSDREAYFTQSLHNRDIIGKRYGEKVIRTCLRHIVTGGDGFEDSQTRVLQDITEEVPA